MNLFNAAWNFIRASSLAVLIFSCNSHAETKAAPQQRADLPPIGAVAAVADTTPFDVIEISHMVKDYDKWRPAFDKDSSARKASGMEFIVIGRNMENPNDLLVVLKVSDVQKAKSFAASPALEDVMEKAGVIARPDVQLFHVIRFEPDSKEKQWVTVTHKVKDFDAWLKVFDEEGKAAREEQGLLDVVLCRAIDDSNMVHLVFDIRQADLAKAKAAITSAEKKDLMMRAGVEGAPKIKYYKSAD
jgi:hypothetical protein